VPTLSIRIDDPLWSTASAARRAEWGTLIADLIRDGGPWPAGAEVTVVIGCDDDALYFRRDEQELRVPRAELKSVLDEYLAVIVRMGEDDLHPMRMEALDMAKRVVHDGGGRRLGELLPDLSPELPVRRRLFSLVVAVVYDTTKHAWAHRHA
jgi:hypothetical protein